MVRIHYWSSSTRNTEALANKLDTPTTRIGKEPVDNYTVLMTPTFEQPRLNDYIPRPVRQWLKDNHQYVIGVIGCGNLNFGSDYCRAAVEIAEKLNVPVLYRCELRGTETDVREIDAGIAEHWRTLVEMRQGLTVQ